MTSGWTIRAVGDAGLVVDLPDLTAVRALHEAMASQPAVGPVVDLVPGARSLLVRVRPGTELAAVARAIRSHQGDQPAGTPAAATEPVVIAVRYDGPDLEEVTELTGLSRDEVVAAHTGTDWTVGFMGFAPGFGYLVGGDPRLAVPRRAHPRRAVHPGSVALAGEFSGVYPRESPGGWQLIGTTSALLWDVERDPPALVQPGTTVRFERQP